jgi:hypothetical protein
VIRRGVRGSNHIGPPSTELLIHIHLIGQCRSRTQQNPSTRQMWSTCVATVNLRTVLLTESPIAQAPRRLVSPQIVGVDQQPPRLAPLAGCSAMGRKHSPPIPADEAIVHSSCVALLPRHVASVRPQRTKWAIPGPSISSASETSYHGGKYGTDRSTCLCVNDKRSLSADCCGR